MKQPVLFGPVRFSPMSVQANIDRFSFISWWYIMLLIDMYCDV